MNMEPFYIRQTAEPMTDHERRNWFNECADEAKREGAKLCRFSVSDDGLSLVEGWNAIAVDIGDQGTPRFYRAATNLQETP